MNEYKNMMDQIHPGDALIRKTRSKMEASIAVPAKPRFYKVAAACLAVLLFAALGIPNLWENPLTPDLSLGVPPSAAPPSAELTVPGQTPDNTAAPELPVPPEINLNLVDTSMGESRLFFCPETTYRETWNWEQVTEYLGVDFRLNTLPKGFLSAGETSWEVIFNDDGTPFSPGFSFRLDYSESFGDEYDPLRRSLTVEANKGAIPFRCYLMGADEAVPSYINGTEVIIGYWQMQYGPFTVTPPGEPNTPAGYYDLYYAEFMLDGVGYYVRSENLTQEEFVNVLLSIIM
jgi:hypothetical protein